MPETPERKFVLIGTQSYATESEFRPGMGPIKTHVTTDHGNPSAITAEMGHEEQD